MQDGTRAGNPTNSVRMIARKLAGRAVRMFNVVRVMFIGGAPGSCAGGIKVVTFRVLVGYIAVQFRGDHQIVLEGRGVPAENVTRALTLFFIYSLLVGVTVFLLAITEDGILSGRDGPGPSLLRLLFEEVSALGTVGLSVDMGRKTPAGALRTLAV